MRKLIFLGFSLTGLYAFHANAQTPSCPGGAIVEAVEFCPGQTFATMSGGMPQIGIIDNISNGKVKTRVAAVDNMKKLSLIDTPSKIPGLVSKTFPIGAISAAPKDLMSTDDYAAPDNRYSTDDEGHVFERSTLFKNGKNVSYRDTVNRIGTRADGLMLVRDVTTQKLYLKKVGDLMNCSVLPDRVKFGVPVPDGTTVNIKGHTAEVKYQCAGKDVSNPKSIEVGKRVIISYKDHGKNVLESVSAASLTGGGAGANPGSGATHN